MMDYYYGNSYRYYSTNPVPFLIISFIVAIAATVLAFVFLLPEKNRAKLNGFFKKLADILNFKSFLIEKVLKFTYIALSVFVFLFGFFMLFMQEYGQSLALAGFLIMIFVPILLRLIYEASMLFIVLTKNVIELNKKTPSLKEDKKAEPQVRKCQHCGVKIGENDAFCQTCGKPQDR